MNKSRRDLLKKSGVLSGAGIVGATIMGLADRSALGVNPSASQTAYGGNFQEEMADTLIFTTSGVITFLKDRDTGQTTQYATPDAAIQAAINLGKPTYISGLAYSGLAKEVTNPNNVPVYIDLNATFAGNRNPIPGIYVFNISPRVAQLPIQWADATCALVNNIFYIVGGYSPDAGTAFTGAYSYNPLTNTYAVLNNPGAAHGLGAIAVAVGTKIYLIGGAATPQRVDVFDTIAGTWANKTNATHSYTNGPVACYNLNGDNKIHVFNGTAATPYHDVYDPVGDSWALSGNTPPSPTQFSSLGVRSDGKVIIVGGTPAPSGNKAMIYDPVATTWSTGTTVYPTDSESGSSALTFGAPRENAVFNDKLFIVTGQQTAVPNQFLANCYIYDMNADTYTLAAPMNGPPRDGTCGTFFYNMLYLFGGRFAQVSNVDACPFVDVMSVLPAQGNLLSIWNANEWEIYYLGIYDPGGFRGIALPYQIWRALVSGPAMYLYYIRADVGTPGAGGATGRVYQVYNKTTASVIRSLTIAPAGATATGGFFCSAMGTKYAQEIVIRANSDDGATKASDIFLTVGILVNNGNRILG